MKQGSRKREKRGDSDVWGDLTLYKYEKNRFLYFDELFLCFSKARGETKTSATQW